MQYTYEVEIPDRRVNYPAIRGRVFDQHANGEQSNKWSDFGFILKKSPRNLFLDPEKEKGPEQL